MSALRAPTHWAEQFPPNLQAALVLADAITQGDGHVSDEVWQQAAAHFDEGQLVELVADIGLFNYFNRFNNALEIEVTQLGWPAK